MGAPHPVSASKGVQAHTLGPQQGSESRGMIPHLFKLEQLRQLNAQKYLGRRELLPSRIAITVDQIDTKRLKTWFTWKKKSQAFTKIDNTSCWENHSMHKREAKVIIFNKTNLLYCLNHLRPFHLLIWKLLTWRKNYCENVLISSAVLQWTCFPTLPSAACNSSHCSAR